MNAPRPLAATARSWATESRITGVRRVFIADDRVRTRRALSAVLATHAGCKLVGEAADGAEAHVAVEQLQPDIVILDVRMPHLDGITATMQIKTS